MIILKSTLPRTRLKYRRKNTEIGNEVSLKGGAAPTFNNVSVDYGDATLNAQVKFAIEANAKYAVSNFWYFRTMVEQFQRNVLYPVTGTVYRNKNGEANTCGLGNHR